MARVLSALVVGVLLASLTLSIGAADSPDCMADGETQCPSTGVTDDGVDVALPAAVLDDLSLATDAAIADAQITPAVTRTLGPPTVVNPFAGTAAPAAQSPEVVSPRAPAADQQKLPPGPPSRLP